jgi:predicted Fe-Mo cluster-binding NifX family protein
MMGVDLLICGAISAQLETQLRNMNIRIYPWVRGKVDLILAAFAKGGLDREELRLPGCRGRGRGFQRRHGMRKNFGKFNDES